MLLENKNAIIYGAGGGIGRGVALAFAREGARVFLSGRTRETVEQTAREVQAAGGSAEAAVVDALDEQAVEAYVQGVAARAGHIDVSFNLITRGDVQGIPLVDMRPADLTQAVMVGLTSQFLTARAAARTMVKQGSGVILMLTSGSTVGAPMMGSTPAADAAMEALMRGLATELGPQGVRVVGMWTAGVPETLTPEKISRVNENMKISAEDLQRMLAGMAQMTMLRRAPALAQVADTAAFLASDLAGGITGTITNVTCGMVPW
jgi:NAD(P)-dependent dehydrogenase (short-subunit alcohol dehydrogenase family)